ncbi:MAG: glycoside hydrolase [Tannerellaceae bacterium]|nr:glycoside hydrolase [Tannerellaceae bacterium]
MKKISLALVVWMGVAFSSFGQDFYSRGERDYWLQKAQEYLPELTQRVVTPKGVVDMVGDTACFQGWKAAPSSSIEAFYERSLKSQSGVVLDFGEHLTGYFTFVVSPMNSTPDAPARLKFTFGEVPSELVTPFDPYRGGLSRAWLQDETVTVMTVPDTVTIPRRLAFRYVKVELLHAPGYEFTISHASCKAVTSVSAGPEPLPPSVPQLIRDIDRIGLHTLKECMQTVYEDGPKRDQRLWIGDLYLEALANMYSFKQHGLTKRCLYLLAALADESGILNAAVFERPHPHPQAKQILYDYALLYNVALKNYLEATGDRQTAEDLWKVAKRQLEIAAPYVRDNGLLDFEKANREYWIFFDWRDGLHREVAFQGVTMYAFQQTLELAEMLGVEKEVAHLPRQIKRMTAAARNYLYDKKTGLFTGTLNRQVSYTSQVWMILSGVATKAEAQRAIRALQTAKEVVRPGTPYAYHYYIQSLVDCGMEAEAKEALTGYWGGMVRKGADTFWEAYDPENDTLSPYGFFPINSYCHAWSCTPVYFIRKYPGIFQ